jgi:hypothetical protein
VTLSQPRVRRTGLKSKADMVEGETRSVCWYCGLMDTRSCDLRIAHFFVRQFHVMPRQTIARIHLLDCVMWVQRSQFQRGIL